MALARGTRIGPYEIGRQIGAGGMGEVYVAVDTRLARDVAIKVLPEAFAQDPERLARFEREARSLAALNHPNVATIHGLEQTGASQAIVMELVEGPTLADRIAHGSLPLNEALKIARQVADALEAAHEKGIVHRDLKPANIKCAPDGIVKVLDFGLAKMVADAAVADVTDAATTAAGATRDGSVLGTTPYMSPEQARGEAVDKRTDIWAFGCVLYEMLTGRSTFGRSSMSETVAAVLDREPDWNLLPASTPAPLQHLLRRCLEKVPKRRLRDIGDAGSEIDELLSGTAPTATPRTVNESRRAWWPVIAVAALVAAAAGGWLVWRSRAIPPPPAAPELRLEITTPLTPAPESVAVAPDGLTIVFAADAPGNESGLWLRDLTSGGVRLLPGTEQATEPFWSPDGRSVAFFAGGKLKRLDLAGGAAQTLADAPDAHGGTWSANGQIFFAPTRISPVYRVPAAGGDPTQVTRLDGGQLGHSFPRVLNDAERLLYYVTGDQGVRGVYVAAVDGTDARRLLPELGPATEGLPGYLLFVRNATVFAHAFDAGRAALTGDPIRVADDAFPTDPVDGMPVSASPSGAVAFRARPVKGDRQLIWFDRSGVEVSRVGAPAAAVQAPALSPDGRLLAMSRVVDGNRDIWLLEVQRGVLTRFTFDPATEGNPRWARDGSRVYFNSNRSGTLGIYRKAVAGGAEEPVVVTRQNSAVNDVSPDGSTLAYLVADPKTLLDIWALPLAGGQPRPLVQTSREDVNVQIAPNGTWFAYQSSESGRYEISLQPFQSAGRPIQVSTGGGTQPRWRGDGRELFFLDLQGRLMAVSIAFGTDGQSVSVGTPQPLFTTRIGGATIAQGEYLVSPEGQRFLLDTPFAETAPPITVILNWRPTSEPAP